MFKQILFGKTLKFKLAQSLFEQIGYHWKSVQGPAYFKYDGEILSDRRTILEEENSGDDAE